MPRLYREAPLNSIWEGSGNVNALDVLRALAKQPARARRLPRRGRRGLAAPTRGSTRSSRACASEFADPEQIETRARRVVEHMALALQGSLLVRHAPAGGRRRVLRVAPGGRRRPGVRHAAGRRGLRGDRRAPHARALDARGRRVTATTRRRRALTILALVALVVAAAAARATRATPAPPRPGRRAPPAAAPGGATLDTPSCPPGTARADPHGRCGARATTYWRRTRPCDPIPGPRRLAEDLRALDRPHVHSRSRSGPCARRPCTRSGRAGTPRGPPSVRFASRERQRAREVGSTDRACFVMFFARLAASPAGDDPLRRRSGRGVARAGRSLTSGRSRRGTAPDRAGRPGDRLRRRARARSHIDPAPFVDADGRA